jgi:hypothetical protein
MPNLPINGPSILPIDFAMQASGRSAERFLYGAKANSGGFSMGAKKRPVIAIEEVPTALDDAKMAELAKIGKLPPDADKTAFADGVREAARIFAVEARIVTGNDLNHEIGDLLRAAERRRYDEAATLLENLSAESRYLLVDRGARPNIRIELPTPDALCNPERREAACEAIARLCQFGGESVPGRRRPGGKQSRPTWRPLMYAPKPQRNFPKRDAERNFVMWLSMAWLEATGSAPTPTARYGNEGPFARFARECLRLIGAPHADVSERLNELHRRRREMEDRSGKRPPE